MPSNLTKFEYPYSKMKLKNIFKNENIIQPTLGISSKNLDLVYGEDLRFSEIREDRPYTYSSLVTSIDGRIAYSDAQEGPFIASKNFLAREGSIVDWWTLNVLRASADGIIFGANTLSAEKDGTGHVYDKELEEAREKLGRNPVPWNIIPTLDGSDVPFEHIEFTCKEVPIIFYTSPEGMNTCIKNSKKEVEVIGPFKNIDEVDIKNIELNVNKVYVVVTGVGKYPCNKTGLFVLRKLGIEKLLVESPTLLHLFIREELMDELFFNYSCVYLGGNALTIGSRGEEFTSKNHPHTEIISIYMHSPHFLYFRHKLIYGIK